MSQTYARFRLSSKGGLSFKGLAEDGEVEDYAVAIEQGPSSEVCIDFEGLKSGMTSRVGDWFVESGVTMVVEQFQWSNGIWTSNGVAQAFSGGFAGHLGKELSLNNVNVRFQFPQCVQGLTLLYGEYGGNLNLSLNGQFKNMESMMEVNGTTMAGVLITVTSLGTNTGRLTLSGPITSFAIGGQEFLIDHVCLRFCQAANLDFGDAPDKYLGASGLDRYPTLLSQDGARHRIQERLFLGKALDPEPDGLPATGADGDDLNGVDDEDGVTFLSPLVMGQPAQVQVVASATGQLDAWLDFNGNSSWADAGDQIFTNKTVSMGTNILTFAVPIGLPSLDQTYARFRLSSKGGLSFKGAAEDGEVEDYVVAVKQGPGPDLCIDFEGLNPSTIYRVGNSFVDSGVTMVVEQFQWSNGIWTTNGVVRASSSGLAGHLGQELSFNNVNVRFQLSQCVQGLTLLYGEYGGNLNLSVNGQFKNMESMTNVNGTTMAGVLITVTPLGTEMGQLTLSGPIISFAIGGQEFFVDHVCLRFCQETNLDFGDAPDKFLGTMGMDRYPTLLSQDGARHRIQERLFLGKAIDPEPEGLPTTGADGDDLNGADDEDGVTFLSPLVMGQPAQVRVVASATGQLDAWLDFNGNSSWADPGDQIFTNKTVSMGTNILTFAVPIVSQAPDQTYARFRLSSKGGLLFKGLAEDGEVEDYVVPIEQGPSPSVCIDFEGLNLSAVYHIGNWFIESGVTMTVEQFQWSNGIWTSNGVARAFAGGLAGHLGQELNLNSVNVQFQTPQCVQGLTLLYGEYGGNLNLSVNGQFKNMESMTNVNGTTMAGVLITVTPLGTDMGRLTLSGPFSSFAIGGQELFIDHVCLRYCQETNLDFGDAPDKPYPTLLASNGARHTIVSRFCLGTKIDGEADGYQSPNAQGDDTMPASAVDDEDGVVFATPLIPGQLATVNVTTTMDNQEVGRLCVWIDFDGDGSWAEAGDTVFYNVPVTSGLNILTFNVPAAAKARSTFARFRLARQTIKSFDGPAPDGEVEDYQVTIPPPAGCEANCRGTEFWLTFPGNYAPDPLRPPQPSLCVMGDPGTTVKVEIAGLGFSKTVTLPASSFTWIDLPKEADLGDLNDGRKDLGIHVISTQPVTIHGLNHVRYTTDGYLALGIEALGTDYIVQGFGNVQTGVADLNGSQFALVAIATNTTVTITPSFEAAGHPAGVPFNLILNQGQAYQLRTTNDAPADLSGTSISSDKPIAVFGSHRCANVASSNLFFCDYLVEQLIPVGRWGTHFLSAPLATRTKGDTFRFLSAANNNRVYVNGALVATLDKGKFHQTSLINASEITADYPILVTQYANSADRDDLTNADPFMVIIPHTSMYLSNFFIATAPIDFPTNYLNIIAPAAIASAGAVSLDGAPIPAASFNPIAASGYAYAQRLVPVGVHRIAAPAPISVVGYGWAEFDSYGWPGCVALGDARPPKLTCPPDITVTATLQPGGQACGAVVPDLREQVTVSDDCGLSANSVLRQDPPPGTLVAIGLHPITLSISDAVGNVGRCQTLFTVLDPNPPILVCPSNIVVQCTSRQGAPVWFEAFAKTPCRPRIPLLCQPEPGSLFPPGVTTVLCRLDDPIYPLTCNFTVQVVCGTKIGFIRQARNLTLDWTSPGILQRATNVLGPWQDVSNATSPFTIPTTGPSQQYFRLR
jgi:hypothetical protein